MWEQVELLNSYSDQLEIALVLVNQLPNNVGGKKDTYIATEFSFIHHPKRDRYFDSQFNILLHAIQVQK